MSTPALALAASVQNQNIYTARTRHTPDLWMWVGFLVAAGAVLAGIAATGVSLRYFLQPTGLLIVLGGTLGVTLIGTPRKSIVGTFHRLRELTTTVSVDRAKLIEEMLAINRIRRAKGLFVIDDESVSASHPFLRDVLRAAADAPGRAEFHAAIESRIRVEERQCDAGARALEIAGGFAPTLGVLGTVVGLIDILRQFSNLAGVADGIGTAFVSTIYGLALANLCLLPAAYRLRAQSAEALELQEMIFEAGLCIYDGLHPLLMKERLCAFVSEERAK